MPGFPSHIWRKRVLALPIPHAQKCVLIALAEYADYQTGRDAWPGRDRLMVDAGVQRVTVNRALNAGRKHGVIVQTGAGRKRLNAAFNLVRPDSKGLSTEPLSDSKGLSTEPLSDTKRLSTESLSEPKGLSTEPLSDSKGLSTEPLSDTKRLSTESLSEPKGLSTEPLSEPKGLSTEPLSEPKGLCRVAHRGSVESPLPTPRPTPVGLPTPIGSDGPKPGPSSHGGQSCGLGPVDPHVAKATEDGMASSSRCLVPRQRLSSGDTELPIASTNSSASPHNRRVEVDSGWKRVACSCDWHGPSRAPGRDQSDRINGDYDSHQQAPAVTKVTKVPDHECETDPWAESPTGICYRCGEELAA